MTEFYHIGWPAATVLVALILAAVIFYSIKKGSN